MTNIYVYADESGVFDNRHNRLFSFGGLLVVSREARDRLKSRYEMWERRVRKSLGDNAPDELKATLLPHGMRNDLFKATNIATRFGAIVDQDCILPQIFGNKKLKQRYLDYVFRTCLRSALEHLVQSGKFDPNEPTFLHIAMDQHNTATDSRFELRESIESEYAQGIFNENFTQFVPPIIPGLKQGQVTVVYRDSKDDSLVRAADVVANRVRWIGTTEPGPKGSIVLSYFPSI